MRKLNEKTKAEQLFIVLIIFVAFGGLFCVTGCGGGKSCETPKFGSDEYEGNKVLGCSVPGCGGCLSSGKGCDTTLWPQSCKYVSGRYKNDEEDQSANIWACDIRYYGNDCLGCGSTERSCYAGYIDYEDGSDSAKGFFYNPSGSDEKAIGCVNSCGGCVGSRKTFGDMIRNLEVAVGVD